MILLKLVASKNFLQRILADSCLTYPYPSVTATLYILNYLVYLRYKNNVSKAFHYLHDKWQHTLPQDVLLEEVKKVLDK